MNTANRVQRQPGSLLSQFNTFRFAGLSVLGVLSFVIAILSLLYTTAAGALGKPAMCRPRKIAGQVVNIDAVQPQLRLPPWEHTVLAGEVAGDFSNTLKANETCLTEWPDVGDTQWGGSTCLAVKWSSLCGRNFVRYMSAWDDDTARQDPPPWMSDNMPERLPIGAALDNNITVTTTWLDNHDIKTDSEKAGRIVNNITIAAVSYTHL